MLMTESPASAQVAAPEAAPVLDALAQAIDASLKLAMKYHRAGELEHAETLYRGILETLPEHAAANFFLGRLAVGVDQAPAALPHFEVALKEQPDNAEYRLGYIDALIRADHLDRAREQLTLAYSRHRNLKASVLAALAEHLELRERITRTIRDTQLTAPIKPLPITPTIPKKAGGRGLPTVGDVTKLAALYKAQRHAEAQTLARTLTTRFPKHGFAWKALGASLNAQGRPKEALGPMETALKLMPTDAEAQANFARVLDALGRKAEAESAYRRALELNPNDASVHYALGVLLHGQQRLPEAELHCLRTLEIDPSYLHAYWVLGTILKETQRPAEAEETYRQALALNSTYAHGYTLLGMLLSEQDRWTEAEALFRQGIAVEPRYSKSYSNLGLALNAQGRQGEASECFREAVKRRPDDAEAFTVLLFSLSLSHTAGPEALFADHRRFGEVFEAPLRPTWRPHDNLRDPAKPLQVGIVSADLYNHAVSTFFEPVLKHLAGCASLVISAYSNRNRQAEDAMSRQLRQHVKHWHNVDALTSLELAEKIRADGIDILIDLSGHTSGNRLVTFAHKPAPVQVSWMGYPGTTGLESMDYYFCDRFLLPPGQFDSQFTEKLVRLPANAPFQPHAKAPPLNALPALEVGHITFGSFNRLNKFNRQVIAAWSRLMRAVPGSRMILGSMPRGGDSQYAALITWFAEEGIDRERLEFHERTGLTAYLALHHRVDICLDTFPYNGGTTTLHSIWMGVPTLTIPGDTMTGRVGAGILGHVGLDDFAAPDVEAFVARGAAWTQRLPELAEIRAGLRDRFAQSAIGQPALIATGVESALRTMWQRWCAGLPAEPFEAQTAQGDRA